MNNRKLYKGDLENIIRGACLLSSGGGGTYSSGKKLLEAFQKGQYYNQDYVDYVDVDELRGSDTDCGIVVAYMGAPEAIANLEHPEAGVNAAEKMKALMEKDGQRLAYIVPVEIGALSSIVACTVAAKLGIPVINGDGAGRAVPELTMTTFAGSHVPTHPAILANDKGLAIRLDVVNDAAIVEAVARPTISLSEFGQQAGLAMWIMSRVKIEEVVKITDTLIACKKVGELIEKYQTGTEINVDDLLDCINASLNAEVKAYELCSGTLCCAENVTEGGFDHGKVIIRGEDIYKGKTFTILFQNENLLAWDSTSGTPLAMAPDSIAFVVHDDQVVYSNGDLIGENNKLKKSLEGRKVSVIGIPAHSELRDDELKKSKLRAKRLQSTSDKNGEEIRHSFELALEKFGYYGAYVPIEDLQTDGK